MSKKIRKNQTIIDEFIKSPIGLKELPIVEIEKEEILNFEEARKQAYQAARNGEGGKTEPANAGQKGNFTERSYDEEFLNSFYVDGDKIK